MRFFSVLAVTASLLSYSLGSPIAHQHSRFHKRSIGSALEAFAEAYQNLEAQASKWHQDASISLASQTTAVAVSSILTSSESRATSYDHVLYKTNEASTVTSSEVSTSSASKTTSYSRAFLLTDETSTMVASEALTSSGSKTTSYSRAFLLTDEAPTVAAGGVSTSSGSKTTSYSRAFILSGDAPTVSALPPLTSSSKTSTTKTSVVSSSTHSVSSKHSSTIRHTSTSSTSSSTSSTVPVTKSSTMVHTTSSTTVIPAATTSATTSYLRGVNIGNWLVLEKWMDSTNLFSGAFADAVDQYTFDSISGAESALQNHWSTWFTESDMKEIAAAGINAVRVPIGFWSYDNSGTPYITGADAYLEKAIGWARTYGVKVWVDCHGSPGSQNGFDNSGHSGDVDWQSSSNIAQSITILKTMAAKYGSTEYADVVAGLELVNEPISWGNNVFSTTQQFSRDAYAAVKSVASNPDLKVIMHDAFMTPATNWLALPSEVGSSSTRDFQMDTHLYQVFDAQYTSLDGPGHVAAACGWGANLATANATMPIFIGEWSAAMNLCINTDGTTYAGTSCSDSGCQCTSWTLDSWNDGLKQITRKFIEAQLDTFEDNASGYFLWAWKGPGAWGMKNLLDIGVMPNPVTARQYPGQC